MYRKLLHPLSQTPSGEAALLLALELARIWDAHLAAVIVRVDPRSIAPLAGEGLSGAMIEDMMTSTERESAGQVAALSAQFAAALTDAGMLPTNLPADLRPSAGLQIVTGREEEVLPGMAQLADLTVMPHPHDDPDGTGTDRLHAILFESGRPVLIAPPSRPARIGTRCCVAWNGSTEGAAALAAMLPWLRRAQAVRVLHGADYQRRPMRVEAVLEFLAWHGVAADAASFQPLKRDLGAGLLAAAADFGADLLGMGAYSHSRLRQLILGGVTRHVLGYATLPVLMRS